MRLIKKENIEYKILHGADYSKESFQVFDVGIVLKEKKFWIDLNSGEEEYVILMLSTANKGFMHFDSGNFMEKYEMLLNDIKANKIYERKFLLGQSGIGVYLIELKSLLRDEEKFFELILLFRFTSIMGLKPNVTQQEIHRVIRKPTLFSGLFSFRRWKNVCNWFYLFDGEHFSGSLVNWTLSQIR